MRPKRPTRSDSSTRAKPTRIWRLNDRWSRQRIAIEPKVTRMKDRGYKTQPQSSEPGEIVPNSNPWARHDMTKRKQDLPSPGYSVGYGKPRKQHASNLVKAEISKVGHGGDERTLSLRFTGCWPRDSS